MPSSSPPPFPRGAAGAMRLFDPAGRLPKPLNDPRWAPALATLAHAYGAVTEHPDCWRLAYAPQWLTPPPLAGARIQIIDDTASTQQLLHPPPPHIVFAEHQSAGEGRRGRGWLGLPADAIAVSLLLPAPPIITGLGVALAAALAAALSPRALFKWPNDLMTPDRKKFGGILTHLRRGHLHIGIGLNWRMTPLLAARIAALGGNAGALAPLSPHAKDRATCATITAATVLRTVAAYRGFLPHRALALRRHLIAPGDILRAAGATRQFAGFAADGALLAAPLGAAPSPPHRHLTENIHVVGR